MFEKEAEKYVAEKADKGNFDVEKFGKAYFSESAMRLAFKAGADFGFKECAKSRLNITTISDAPIDEEQEKNDFDVLRGKILELDKHNTRLQKACHKWFMRWREAKKDAMNLQKENAELKEKIRLMNEQEARDITSRFPC